MSPQQCLILTGKLNLIIISDSPNQAPVPGGMSSNSGGVSTHAMASGANSSASGQASSSAAAAAVTTPSSGGNTLLWTKTQQLPEEAFRQLHSIYGDHFPLEARHHLAGITLTRLKLHIPLAWTARINNE